MKVSLNVVNLQTATFDCSYGRGCDGICCQNGRPPVPADEARTIKKVLSRALPLMTDRARNLVKKQGFLSKRMKDGSPMLRVIDGWCVFFNQGCVLHKLGAADGEAYRYKPTVCALFPLEHDLEGHWYIRQWGFGQEDWDLFCLNPKNSRRPAADALNVEMKLAERLVRKPGTAANKAYRAGQAKAAKARDK
jgi:Fe-S-cluster containining protein